MSNPWNVNLKKTGLNEKRFSEEQYEKRNLENRQSELTSNAEFNKLNKNIYDERQGSLAASALMGQQGLLGGVTSKARKNKKNSRNNKRTNKRSSKKNKTRKNKKQRK
jgi:hypothetical protein